MKHDQLALVASLMKEKQLNTIYLDNAQMKLLFNVSDRTLYRWRRKKLFFYRKIGGKYYYPLHLVMNLMEEQKPQ